MAWSSSARPATSRTGPVSQAPHGNAGVWPVAKPFTVSHQSRDDDRRRYDRYGSWRYDNGTEAYERVLGEAMLGDATLFARQDYVEEAWRIVDPVLKAGTPIYEYEKGTWGPSQVDGKVSPPGGWHNPAARDEEDFRVAGSSV